MTRSVTAVVLSGLLLAGCGGSSTAGGDTTCEQWIALDPPINEVIEEGLKADKTLAEEQRAILKDALREADLASDQSNMLIAEVNILQYCAPNGTGTRPNANRPIANALD